MIHGYDAYGYHIGNIIIYIITCICLYSLAINIQTSISSARVAALVFCFHPIHVEAVAR